MPAEIPVSKEFLVTQHTILGKSFTQIAKELCCDTSTLTKKAKVFGIQVKRITHPIVDICQQRFGMLIAIEYCGKNGRNNRLWKCKCDCGGETILTYSDILSGHVSSCGCKRYERKNSDYVGDLSKLMWSKIKSSAVARDIEFAITQEYTWKLFESQNGICALSGIPIRLPVTAQDFKRRNYNASLDRIDPCLGYLEGKVQWVDKHINLMKHVATDSMFIERCEKVARYQKLKREQECQTSITN